MDGRADRDRDRHTDQKQNDQGAKKEHKNLQDHVDITPLSVFEKQFINILIKVTD
jgi:hypothetical protein